MDGAVRVLPALSTNRSFRLWHYAVPSVGSHAVGALFTTAV